MALKNGGTAVSSFEGPPSVFLFNDERDLSSIPHYYGIICMDFGILCADPDLKKAKAIFCCPASTDSLSWFWKDCRAKEPMGNTTYISDIFVYGRGIQPVDIRSFQRISRRQFPVWSDFLLAGKPQSAVEKAVSQ